MRRGTPRLYCGRSIDTECMEFILFIYLKTKSMKKWNWKSVLLYVVRLVELVITGAVGGAAGSVL